MKIRTLLIIGLFVLAFTPLLVFMGLNMPRVLTQFRAAELDRQLQLIKGNAREIAMTLKWKQDSLRALTWQELRDCAAGYEQAGTMSEGGFR